LKGYLVKKSLLMIVFVTLVGWGGYTDDAYRLFRRGEYQQAYDLYSLAYREQGNIKAAYNIAVMIEKQYVHDRNILNYRPSEAARWYKIVADSVPETKELKPEYCAKEMYPYYLKTFNKLSRWYREGHFLKRSAKEAKRYRQRALELKRYCKKYPAYGKSAIPHPKSYDEEIARDYLAKCPVAKVIPKADRIGIDRFRCLYYRRFPSEMKRILNLYQLKRLNESPTNTSYSRKRDRSVNQKARRAARPILSYVIENEIVPCYKRAQTKRELDRCFDTYLSRCQVLTLGPVIVCDPGPEGRRETRDGSADKKMTESDRKKAIRKLRKMFKSGDVCPVRVQY